jgi:cobalt-zinc-cadmium efflux system outer membrane protein
MKKSFALPAKGGCMRWFIRRLCCTLLVISAAAATAHAQNPLTWQQVEERFQNSNPSLLAGQLGIEESRAQEITADLRPNPTLGILLDQIDPFDGGPPHSSLGFLLSSATVSYLHERRHKRELRLESAQDGTKISIAGQADLQRTLLFNVRQAFIQILHEKAVLALANENISYYDRLLGVNRDRFNGGAIAQVDLDRLEIQRVQYESDLQTAEVGLRTAKIQLLALLNDRTPIEQFDVTGPYDFSPEVQDLQTLRQLALDMRPDLLSAMQTVEKARNDHMLAVANGSTDPTFSIDAGRNPPIDQYVGVGVSIPLRLFDRNQGEKLRTKLDIDRSERLMEATRAQVFNDVDSAHATLLSTITLLRPYKEHYLPQASRIRDTISFSYEHGAASLLDFLSAQADYRSVQVSYLNLIASYLVAAGQLNLAVGREVIP